MFNMFIIYELSFQLEGTNVTAFKSLCLMYFEALLSTVYTLNLLSLPDWLFHHYNMTSFISSNTVLNHALLMLEPFRLRVKFLVIFFFSLTICQVNPFLAVTVPLCSLNLMCYYCSVFLIYLYLIYLWKWFDFRSLCLLVFNFAFSLSLIHFYLIFYLSLGSI